MSSRVRVLNITHVLPNQALAAAHSPVQPLPDDGLVELSFMDALFVDRVIPMRRLFFYEGPDVPPFQDVVRSLRASLATALAVFRPLSGKLTHRPSAGDVAVDGCSAPPGVEFVEAEFDGSFADMRRVASADGEALVQLGPQLDARQLPAPVLAVQVTRPAVGADAERAVMVAVAVHHAVADGHSVWQFMRAWTAVSRSSEGSRPAAAADLVPPAFDRTALRYPEAEELARKILRAIAPALPTVRSPASCSPPDRSRRTFLLRADEIESVKRRIVAHRETTSEEPGTNRPSTYLAVSSLVWASIARAKAAHLAAGDAYFLVAVDYRRRLGPAVNINERYFGNCVVPCVARAAVRDLCGDDEDGAGLARAAAAIRDAIRAQPEDPVRAMERWLESQLTLPGERFTFTGSSNRFMAYETDFGWGAPAQVELVSPLAAELVLLLGAADGGVQVTATLRADHMGAFASNLVRLSGRGSQAQLNQETHAY